jgi:hypothetical protein
MVSVPEMTLGQVGVGVTELLAAEEEPLPSAFAAVTVKVYGVPFVRPETTTGLPVPVAVWLPGLETAV